MPLQLFIIKYTVLPQINRHTIQPLLLLYLASPLNPNPIFHIKPIKTLRKIGFLLIILLNNRRNQKVFSHHKLKRQIHTIAILLKPIHHRTIRQIPLFNL